MNEYTYEIWTQFRDGKSPWEMDGTYAVVAKDCIEAMKDADKRAANGVMQTTFRYQVRNLRKL
jgi:hypothetical protein